MPLKFYAATDTDDGEWIVWLEHPPDKVELQIRRLPLAEEKRIERKHFGKVRRVVYRKDVEQDLDMEAQEKANREKAAYCMVDSRGFELEVAGADAAVRLSSLLGEKIAKGSVVRLDGRWTDALKDTIFGGEIGPSLVAWIGKQARALRQVEEQAEEEAQGN